MQPAVLVDGRRGRLRHFIISLHYIVAAGDKLARHFVGQILARQVFNLEVSPAFWLVPGGMVGGGLLVIGAGWFASAKLLRLTPLESLRSGV